MIHTPNGLSQMAQFEQILLAIGILIVLIGLYKDRR